MGGADRLQVAKGGAPLAKSFISCLAENAVHKAEIWRLDAGASARNDCSA